MKLYFRNTLVAQLVEHLILDFSPGHDLRVVRSSPRSGSMLRRSLLKIVSFPLSLPWSCSLKKKTKKRLNSFMQIWTDINELLLCKKNRLHDPISLSHFCEKFIYKLYICVSVWKFWKDMPNFNSRQCGWWYFLDIYFFLYAYLHFVSFFSTMCITRN